MELVNWIVPLTVVCGLQIGVGLRLASKGIRDISQLTWGSQYDCIGLAICCALWSMFWLRDNENDMNKKEGAEQYNRRRKQLSVLGGECFSDFPKPKASRYS